MPIKVYDRYGHQQTWDWLRREYGDLVLHPADPGPGWRLVEIWENADVKGIEGDDHPFAGSLPLAATIRAEYPEAPAVIIVKLRLPDGTPIPNTKVAWYWPDAAEDPRCGPANGQPPGMTPNRAERGVTNANGDVGFAMGIGAYYWPDRGEIGPHAIWSYGSGTNSDLLLGLGMRAATAHDSLWPVLEWQEEEPEPPAPPAPPEPPAGLDPQLELLVAAFSQASKAVQAIRELLTGSKPDRKDQP